MKHHAFISFNDNTDLDEAESTLHLAILAAEGLHGEAACRIQFRYERDDEQEKFWVTYHDDASRDIVKIYMSLALKEFGSVWFGFNTK